MKEIELLNWMIGKKIFATHEVIEWGRINFYNRAPNTKSDFLGKGLIRKFSKLEKAYHNYNCKDSVYMTNPKAIERYLHPSLFLI